MLDPIPDILAQLNRLEKTLISKRILFKKITIMPKGQQPKIRGAVCNIPIQADAVSNVLPRSVDNDGVVLVKLKRKIEFKGHVYFESVRPRFVEIALNYLKEHNHFYSNVLINLDNINRDLLCLSDIESIVEKGEYEIVVENENDEHLENNNPLDLERTNSDEMCVIPNIYDGSQNVLDIAPGQNKTPKSFFNDQFCEEQAFPFLLPKGRFGYKATRQVSLSPVKYFNQRLLNYTQRFSSNGDYVFFAHYILQQVNLFNQINIATTKVKGSLNAGQLNVTLQGKKMTWTLTL